MHFVQAVLAQNRMGLSARLGDTLSADLWLLIVTGVAIKPRSVKKRHAPLRAVKCVLVWTVTPGPSAERMLQRQWQ